jgi:hypothetical protein
LNHWRVGNYGDIVRRIELESGRISILVICQLESHAQGLHFAAPSAESPSPGRLQNYARKERVALLNGSTSHIPFGIDFNLNKDRPSNPVVTRNLWVGWREY